MFVTKDGVTIALDSIATVGVGGGSVGYWISFHLKDIAGFNETKDPFNTKRTVHEMRFHYGADNAARDAAYQNFVNKFSITLD